MLVLTAIGMWVENIPLDQHQHQQEIVNKFKTYIDKYETAQFELLDSLSLQQSHYPLQLFVYKNDTVIFWSSDKVAFSPYKISDSLMVKYLSTNDGFYRVCSKKDKEGFSHYSLLKLVHRYPNSVDGIPQNKATRLTEIKDEIHILEHTKDTSYFPVSINEGNPIFYVKILDTYISPNYSLWFYIPAFLLLIYFLIRILVYSKSMNLSSYRLYSGFLFVYMLLLRIALSEEVFIHFLSKSALLSPELLAHSYLSSSYAENFLNILILCFFIILIRKFKILPNKPNFYISLFIVNLSVALFIFWELTEIQHLIIDSNINLDPIIIDKLNEYTLLGIVLIVLYFALLFVFCGWLHELFGKSLKINRFTILSSFLIQVLFAVFLVHFFSTTDNISLTTLFLAWIFLSLMMVYFIIYFKRDGEGWIRIFLVFAFVMLNTAQINGLLEKKEMEYRKLYAYKILHERDLELERRLLEAENKIERNNVFESCIYEDSAFNRIEFEEILKYNYLIDFLSDFDIFIESYSGLSKTWSEQEKQGFNNLFKIYMETSEDGLSHSFLKVKESSGFSGYISAHITGEFDTPEFQSVFILLRQKVRSSQKALSEFAGESAGIPFSPYHYYHALYINNKLSRVSPEFPFERFNEEFKINKQEEFIEKSGFSFYVYKPEPERLLILAIPLRTLTNKFTVFAGLILSVFLIWFFVLSLRLIIRLCVVNAKRIFNKQKSKLYLPSFKNMLLQSKIQTALMVELILSFVAGTVMVANFISKNYEDTQQRQILEKIKGISGELEKSGMMDFGIKTGPKREFLIDLSESYNIDISLFNLNGTLWLSSSPDLYRNAVINEFMNPVAFEKLSDERLYSFNQNERLYGYKYSSYYQSFFNRNQQLSGFIHLPFFARQQETIREQTSLLVDMLNIFVVFFIITVVFSVFLSKVITRPLASIALSLRRLRVGGKNEEITWQSNDEIGQLVKTYNAVLHQLEESIRKLASTEREGAWREMAKQVAHEIKNPLTPMRLSVQHLQRSISDTDVEVQQKVKKVTDLLINQIDLMSKMAEEFSSFAKMPIAIPENLDISRLLKETVELFEKTDDFIIHLDGCDNTAVINADKDQIKRVFINLIKNAYQAKKDNHACELIITSKADGEILTISFSDNGVGIDASLREKIFHPNFSTKTSGMGLGLAISKKILELAGGSIHFESTPNVGSIFYITLPVAKV